MTSILSAVLTNNFIFSQFLGCCPFLGCSSKVDTAVGMGLAVTFVMGLASAICWVVDEYVLMPLGLAFLQTLTFILVIAALVQFVEMFLKKSIPSLYSALGIYLPLITTNCAVLGVVLLNVQNKYNFIESTVYGITGFMPLKPMKARASRDAVTRQIGKPSKLFGYSANSTRSRTEANRTIASRKPRPPVMP